MRNGNNDHRSYANAMGVWKCEILKLFPDTRKWKWWLAWTLDHFNAESGR